MNCVRMDDVLVGISKNLRKNNPIGRFEKQQKPRSGVEIL